MDSQRIPRGGGPPGPYTVQCAHNTFLSRAPSGPSLRVSHLFQFLLCIWTTHNEVRCVVLVHFTYLRITHLSIFCGDPRQYER